MTRGNMRRALVVAVMLLGTAVAACGSSAPPSGTPSPTPSQPPGTAAATDGVTGVVVTVSPGVSGASDVREFNSADKISAINKLFKDHQIRQLYQPVPVSSCSGTDTYIALRHADGSSGVLHVHVCGSSVTGNMSGDIAGFLADLSRIQ